MTLTARDVVGALMVAGTMGAVVIHSTPWGHGGGHQMGAADAGGSVTTAVDVQYVAFVDVNVVVMDGDDVLRHQVVVVQGDLIQKIGPLGVVEPPAGARIVDGGGMRYLVPGLTDAHVHLPEGSESWLPLFLANGVTTVFNLDGDERHLRLRERIRSGELVGPTLYTAGPFTNEPEISTTGQATASVRRQADLGYDFVKIHGELREDVFRALTQAGRDEGIPIVGHAPRNLPFSAVLENGQTSVVHAEDLIYTRFPSLDTGELSAAAEDMASAGTWLTPTLSTFGNISSQWASTQGLDTSLESPAAQYLPEQLRQSWMDDNPYIARDALERSSITAMFEFQHPMILALHEAGVPMLTGTDAPLPGMTPGFSLHDEIQALRDAGLTSYEVLAAATRNPGRFVRDHVDPSARFGSIRVGSRADLVLVSGDPTEHLERLRTPDGVMVRGQWYDRSALDRMLAKVRERR